MNCLYVTTRHVPMTRRVSSLAITLPIYIDNDSYSPQLTAPKAKRTTITRGIDQSGDNLILALVYRRQRR